MPTAKTVDQTRRMPRLIWVFAGRTCNHFVGFVTRRLIYLIFTEIRRLWSLTSFDDFKIVKVAVENSFLNNQTHGNVDAADFQNIFYILLSFYSAPTCCSLNNHEIFYPYPYMYLHSNKNEPPHDKTNNVAVRPEKTQISLDIRPVWSESSLSVWINLGSLATHWAHSEDSDRTGRIYRLIWVFAGRTLILLCFVMSWLK